MSLEYEISREVSCLMINSLILALVRPSTLQVIEQRR